MQPGIPTSKKGKFDSEMNPLSGIPMAYITRNEGVDNNRSIVYAFLFCWYNRGNIRNSNYVCIQ